MLPNPGEERTAELGVTGPKAHLASDSMRKNNERTYPIIWSMHILGVCLVHMLHIWGSQSLSGTPAMAGLSWH